MKIVTPNVLFFNWSNFWAGMTESYYYARTEEYRQILDRKKIGVHQVNDGGEVSDDDGDNGDDGDVNDYIQVPMVHSCLLVNLKLEESDLLAYTPAKVIIMVIIVFIKIAILAKLSWSSSSSLSSSP